MFSLASRLAHGVSNATHFVAHKTIQVSCILLVSVTKVSAYAHSLFPLQCQEFWEIGHGALLSFCGFVTVANATRIRAFRKWRYPVIAFGTWYIGFGTYTIIYNIGKLCSGGRQDFSLLASREIIPLNLQLDREPICLKNQAPAPFKNSCDLP